MVSEKEECIARYRRILQLLEEDAYAIQYSLKGDVLIAYRRLLEQEMDLLNDAIKALFINY